ncbi:MAG: hypothetical protein Q7R71_01960 [bacterium]|nr:hypothetical protein [bacterium]
MIYQFRIYLAKIALFVATLLAIRSARRGDITEGKKILADQKACELLPHRLRIRLGGAIGWQEGSLDHESRKARDAFFAHKREHPESVLYKDLTPLGKRMQSGGA